RAVLLPDHLGAGGARHSSAGNGGEHPHGGAGSGGDPYPVAIIRRGRHPVVAERAMSNLPRDTYHQHLYPRLRGYSVGDDGEVTTHLCLGLPCCGLDLLIEHSPQMTALELYQIAGEFLEMRQ